VLGDGKDGYASKGPYDIIHVGVAVEVIPPSLIDQLNIGGVLWIPIGPKGHSKTMFCCTKENDGSLNKKELMQVNFSEMSSVEEQLTREQRQVIFFVGNDDDSS
jgi:protein-L-isoaspartate(D-aspartate) O-methyltransferase